MKLFASVTQEGYNLGLQFREAQLSRTLERVVKRRGGSRLYRPMVTTLLTFSIVSLVLILRYAVVRGWRSDKLSIQDWEHRKHEVDLEIFRAILDRDDLRYLRTSLSPREFQALQRKRIRIALRILRLVQENADLLTGVLGLTELKCVPAALEQESDEFANGVMQLRLNLIRAKISLYLEWVFPFWAPSLPALSAQYQRLVQSFTSLQQQDWRQVN